MLRNDTVIPGAAKWQYAGLFLGVVGLGMLFVAHSQGEKGVFHAYLFGFIAWMGLTLGCLGLVLLQNLVRSAWANGVSRFFEAGSRAVPLMFVFFLPILLIGLQSIYPWANPEEVAQSEVIKAKVGYLNVDFFTLRAFIYFVLWSIIAFVLGKWSIDEDKTGDSRFAIKRTNFAAPMTVLFVLSVTFAVTDWVMSVQTEWFSMIFGLLLIVGQSLTAVALATTYLTFVYKRSPYFEQLPPNQFRDLGNLLLTLVILWAYMSFSQFLIIWSGNLPEETSYYLMRREGEWWYFGVGLIFLHFLLPFFLLLSSRLKKTPAMLQKVTIYILLIRIADIAWMVLPTFSRDGFPVSWMDLAAFVGMGGIWVAFFCWNLRRIQLLPTYSPVSQAEAVEHA